VHPEDEEKDKSLKIRRESQLTTKKSIELVSLPPLPLRKMKEDASPSNLGLGRQPSSNKKTSSELSLDPTHRPFDH